MTTMTNEIDDYVTAVHTALADLPNDERQDLLDDLPQHLADVRADRGGALVELLGPPEAYAAELRATAGLDAPHPSPWRRSLLDGAARADARIAPLLGYERSAELVRALAPGWWLLRGWLVAELVTGATGRTGRRALLPAVNGSPWAGVVVLVVAVAASLWLGRQALARLWQRSVITVLGVGLAVYGVIVVRDALQPNTYYVQDSYSDGATGDLSNIYPVSPDGTVLRNVRLYDQDGNPVQLGNAVCDPGSDPSFHYDGAPGTAAATSSASSPDGAALYPLTCAANQGPFGSGRAPALPSSSPSPSASPATTPAASLPSAPVSPAATHKR